MNLTLSFIASPPRRWGSNAEEVAVRVALDSRLRGNDGVQT